MHPDPPPAIPLLKLRLAGMFFIHFIGPGMWMVALGNVMAAHGMADEVPLAYALGPLSALLSPLAAGALADRQVQAQQVLRWATLLAAVFLTLAFFALDQGWGALPFLLLLGAHSFFFTPTFSLATSVVMSHAEDPRKHFPLLRVWATLGWILAGVLVSFVLKADFTTTAGYAAAAAMVASWAFSWLLPPTPPPAASLASSGWRGLLGLDVLGSFRRGDPKVFIITSALVAIPMAAFFPFAPRHLRDLGVGEPTALMTLGQAAETIAMVGLGWLLAHARLKWIFGLGLGFAVLRYVSMAVAARTGWVPLMSVGLAMHGLVYTFYFVTAQIFLEVRVDKAVRARGQALLTTVSGGLGALGGTLLSGVWHRWCFALDLPRDHQWSLFWWGMTVPALAAAAYFFTAYRGRDREA